MEKEDKYVGVQTTMFDVKPTYAFVEKRQRHTEEKHKAIRARFKELYDTKRLRIDDVTEQLSKEYFLAVITIERILRKG